MNFDGAGNVTGSGTAVFDASPTRTLEVVDGILTGIYSTNPGGTGSVVSTIDVGASITFAMAIADNGQSIQLVGTAASGGLSLSTSGVSGVARAVQAGPPKGSYGFQLKPASGARALC